MFSKILLMAKVYQSLIKTTPIYLLVVVKTNNNNF